MPSEIAKKHVENWKAGVTGDDVTMAETIDAAIAEDRAGRAAVDVAMSAEVFERGRRDGLEAAAKWHDGISYRAELACAREDERKHRRCAAAIRALINQEPDNG